MAILFWVVSVSCSANANANGIVGESGLYPTHKLASRYFSIVSVGWVNVYMCKI